MRLYTVFFALLVGVGSFLRLYNFENRLIYGPEQAISLSTSASNINQFSLLGETNLIRKTTTGHIPFPDATYSYLILPILVLFKFDPLPITYFFAFLNVATGVLLSYFLKKYISEKVSLLCLFFFMFSAPMVHHSLFVWIVNPTPLLSVLTLLFGYKLYLKNDNFVYPLALGLFSGLGFGMQKMYIVYLLLVLLWVGYISLNKIRSVVMFVFGVMLGNLPTIIFDIRHEFYHLKTFWQYFLESISGQISSPTTYYNFLYFYPVLFLVLALVCNLLLKNSKAVAIALCAMYVVSNINSPFIDFKNSTGMVKNITLSGLKNAAITIANDKPPENFNVVTLWDFDTRANTMRYLLTYLHNLRAMSVEDYKSASVVYALAPATYNINEPRVWELQEFLPYKVSVLSNFAEGYTLYRLSK